MDFLAASEREGQFSIQNRGEGKRNQPTTYPKKYSSKTKSVDVYGRFVLKARDIKINDYTYIHRDNKICRKVKENSSLVSILYEFKRITRIGFIVITYE